MSARRSTGIFGGGCVLLVVGEPGMGKSALLAAAAGTPSGGGLLSVTGGSFRRGQQLAASLLLRVAMPCFWAALRARTGPARLSARR